MRRLHARLATKSPALAATATAVLTFVLGGCGSSAGDVDSTVKAGTGKVIQAGPPAGDQAVQASEMQRDGEIMNKSMQQSAAAMAAAKQRTGGK